MDGARFIDNMFDKLANGVVDKLIDDAANVISTFVAASMLGDKSLGTEDVDKLENNTEITTTAATNMIQINTRNYLAFSCLYYTRTGSSGTPSYTGLFVTSVASRWIMDSSSLLFCSIDLGGPFIGSVMA